MCDSKKFLSVDKQKWREFVRKNTLKNHNGDAVISRDDSWFYEDVWDKDFKELMTVNGDSSAGRLVR